MNQESVTVFGVSRGETGKRGFAFADVLAIVDGAVVKTIDNPREQFPTDGTIYIEKAHWIPERGVGAIWKVQEKKAVPEGQRWAAYSAVGRGHAGPLEIVSVQVPVSRPEEIRRLLIAGIPLGYGPGTSVLIRTSDGVHLGPIACDHSDQFSRTGIRVRTESLAEPLGRWDRPADLRPFAVNWNSNHRAFTSLLNLPEAPAFLDCSDFSECVRAVLKYASTIKLEGFDLTKKRVDALAAALASDSSPKKIWARASRAIESLRVAATTAGEWQVVNELLMARSDVQAALARVVEEARAEEERRINADETEAKKRIAALAARERETKERVADLERQIVIASRKADALIDDLVIGMRRRIVEVGRDPTEAFSGAALLRAVLLATPGSVALEVESDSELAEQPKALGTKAEILSQLDAGLRSAGLAAGSAQALGREVLATALAGQVATFSGSLGMLIAGCVGRVLAGQYVFSISIPVGLLGSRDFSRCVQEVIAASKRIDSLSALIIHGINHSALDLYAERLVSLIADRQLTASDRAPNLLVLATASNGPGSLPLPKGLSDLGPILDTDLLSTASTRASISGRFTVQSKIWRDLVNTFDASADSGQLLELAAKVGGSESMLFRKTLQSAHARLTAVYDNMPPTPLQSLAFGWLLPRAQLCELSSDRLPAELQNGLVDSRDADKRVSLMVDRLSSKKNGA